MRLDRLKYLAFLGAALLPTGCIVVGSEGVLDLGMGNGASIYVACDPSSVPFGGGTGAPADPYALCSTTHFQNMSGYPSAHFILAQSLELSGVSHTPFALAGSFNGNYFTLSGLSVTAPNGGLFLSINSGAVVQNLTLSSASLFLTSSGGAQNMGIVTGQNLGTISQVFVSGALSSSSTDAADRMGGIAGINGNSGVIENVQVSVSASVSSGGMVRFGGVASSNSGLIRYATVTLNPFNLSNTSSSFIGGVAAENLSSGIIMYSSVSGNIYGYSIIGGIAGLNNGQITNSTYQGGITVMGSVGGGIVGENAGPSAVISQTNTVSSTLFGDPGTFSLGGFAGRHSGGASIQFSSSDTNMSFYGYMTGGFIGEMLGGSTNVHDSVVYGDTVQGGGAGAYVGGFVGYASISGGAILDHVAVEGTVYGTDQVGGLIGRLIASGGGVQIRSSYFNGFLSAYGNAGGLVGYGSSSGIELSYSTGEVRASAPAPAAPVYFGGIAGTLDGSAFVLNSYSLSTLRNNTDDPDNYFGGLVGQTQLGGGSPSITQTYFAGSIVNSTYGAATNPGTYDAAVRNLYAGTTLNSIYYDTGRIGGTSSLGAAVVGCTTANLLDGNNATCDVGLPAGASAASPWVFTNGLSPTLYWE